MIGRVLNYLKSHPAVQVGVLIWGIAGPILGYFGHDFLSYRSEERTEIRSDYSQVQAQAALIRIELQDFSQAALGRRALPSATEINQLRTNISQLYAAAQHVVIRVPSASPQFKQYGDAMVHLQLSAERINGPLNGKPFTEAVSSYLVAERSFDQQISKMQCFLCLAS